VNEALAAAETERAKKAADAAEAQRHIADDRLKLSSLRQVCRAWAEVINARNAEQRQIAQHRWKALVTQESVKRSLAGHVDLDQLWNFADEAYKQQNALQHEPPKNPTDGYHVQLMQGITKLRNELLGCETIRPSLESARKVAFEIVGFCINNTNDLLVEKKRSYGEAAPYIREFWNQYWGDMILVEGRDVAIAMENYGKVLNELRDYTSKPADAASPADSAPPPPPREPSTAKGSDVKSSPPKDRPGPPTARDLPPPASAKSPTSRPESNPKPGSRAAAPSPKESELLDRLKTLPLDQAERVMRMMRERELPADLLNRLRVAHKELRDKLAAEGDKPLAEVLRN
jgi:hypothetical protein